MSLESAAAIAEGLRLASWTATELWRATLGIGGEFSRSDVAALADGSRAATPLEHDILASALNDHFLDRGGDRPTHHWRDLRAGAEPPPERVDFGPSGDVRPSGRA